VPAPPRPALAHSALRRRRPAGGRPFPRGGVLFAPLSHFVGAVSLLEGGFPLPRRGAGGCSSSSVASPPATLADHSDSALGARAEGAAASGPVTGGSSASTREMWYGVFLWALVSSLFFHVPAGLLALFTLRHHKYGRFMSVSILLMGIVGPITAGILTSAAIAGVYRAAGKEMIPFEALTLGTGQTFCVVVVSFLRVLATL
uniref:Transmembrane protein 170A n=8 Tax=Boreoeutheria TaxID=1437010 RepID=A0ABI7W7I7_FELCA